ncbi:MAG TPA: maleylpyruvate isomerase N-terminal domain-containing protein [Amycolatopsis sp.]|uniref:maleylpyruvate isomerase N-terminal domain-containing protein n=1 Tax=Amycolatopsis sp. TaxID=37632 RepID=UPI002F3F2764
MARADEEVLAGALDYAVASAGRLGVADLGRPSACAGWTVADALAHLTWSLRCLSASLTAGAVRDPAAAPGDLAGAAAALLAAARHARSRRSIAVDGLPLRCHQVLVVGAIEAAVHGWDVGGRSLPDDVAVALLPELPLVLGDRRGLFAGPVALPPGRPAAERLLAAVGRDPARTDSFSRRAVSNGETGSTERGGRGAC